MHINGFSRAKEFLDRQIADLRELVRAASSPERPCPRCTRVCGCANVSTTCACGCHPSCAEAPRMLSSEGDRYPIEPAAVPVVYSLSTLRLLQPCWSCEGHWPSGESPRAPAIWFYSPAVVYLELLTDHLARLGHAGQLSARWEVAVREHRPSDGASAFVLRPRGASGGDIHLGQLQQDLRRIGADLPQELRRLATARIDSIERFRHASGGR